MHPNPEKGHERWSAIALDPKQFAKMMADLKPHIALCRRARPAVTT
jgi:hypothetical protein